MKHLLVIADKQDGKNTALMRAISLQQQMGGKITLLGFSYADIKNIEDLKLAKLSRNQLEKKIITKRKQELRSLLDGLKDKPTKITIEAQWNKNIVPAINAYCDKHPVDMILKTTSRSNTLMYTSTDWQLLRESQVPVMITAKKSWKKKPNIIAALDFGSKTKSKIKLNHTIIKQAQFLAQSLGQDVHIAFAITVPQALVDMDLINPNKYAREKRQKLQPVIDAFCVQYAVDKKQLHIKVGSPDKVIPSIANTLKSDLVVTGTMGRKGVKGKLIGNTAELILSKLHTDILALKP